MATVKKKAGLGSTIGGILGGPLGFLGGRAMDRKNQAIKDETIQPAKHGKKIVKKMQDGGKAKSFPDLNKDGKITKADILKGRGVIKNGAALKKQAAKAIAMKKAGKAPKKAISGMMMKGGGKCKNGC